MLTAIRASDNSLVRAAHQTKAHGPFLCPDCRAEVSLNRGTITVPHFSHRGVRGCRNAAGETSAHRKSKLAIYEALLAHPEVSGVELERPFGTVRADVFTLIRGLPVAIEVQISTLSPEAIAYRTAEYARKGIYVLWLLQWTGALEAYRYSPRRFERWLHAAYFGRVYYWESGLTVIPYQFRDKHTHVPRQVWKDSRGRTHRAGGYDHTSKRFKIAVRGRTLDIVRDFVGVDRAPWRSKTIAVPEAKVYLDTKRGFDQG